jgi:hypothetical protein
VFKDNYCVTSARRTWVEGRSDENRCSRESDLQSSVVVCSADRLGFESGLADLQICDF